MQIEKAKETGFCFGVRRALKLLDEAVLEHGYAETLGLVVHNQQVIDDFNKRGVRVLDSIDQVQGDIVVIPSHGVPPQIIEKLKKGKIRIIDSTCTIVRKAQMAAKELSERGFQVIVFGDLTHSEVKGVLGWAGEGGIATTDKDIILRFDKFPSRLGFLSQTTQNPAHFADFLSGFITSSIPQVKELCIINTLCDVTRRRQQAALNLARGVDLMIVIGGRNSANTRCLAEICSSAGVETHRIEGIAEINDSWLENRSRIGVTTGTSTPDQVTQEVIQKLETVKRSSNGA